MNYHSEVVGSLLQAALLSGGEEATRSELRLMRQTSKVIEDRAVNEAIALQETAGIDIITDGELRRYLLSTDTSSILWSGFDKLGADGPFLSVMKRAKSLVLKRPVVVEKLQWKRSMCAEEWVYLRSRKTHVLLR